MSRAAHNLILALRAFGRARQGATAVEFAFIAGPLLMLIFGILELALVFMMSTALESATSAPPGRSAPANCRQAAAPRRASLKRSVTA